MPPKPRDAKELVRWRRSELLQHGFSPSLAARVARDQRYELHDLIELVEHGCSPSLAVRILSPLGGAEATSRT